jgi:pyruvate/2-oxoglutarate dehydrogenase complex dihydrolipoamide dehydrogenase (E3) component
MSDLIQLQPQDEYNLALESHVKPRDWVNPTPTGRYNLVVIGGGTAGLISAIGAAGLGAKVALIERELLGGDCLNVGCVPSKGLISAARAARAIRYADEFGIEVPTGVDIDFARVMERMRRLRSEIAPNDSAERIKELGVDLYLGNGRFTSSNTVEVDGQTLKFRKAVIATGARASAPSIPGLDQVPYLTNESLFSLTELPKRLGIIGAGPIGCEMAQAFSLLGSEVFLVEAEHGILPREDPDASRIVQASIEKDGVKLLCCGRELQLHPDSNAVRLSVNSHDQQYDQTVDKLLVSVGRAPNVQNLGLETVGVDFDERIGVTVNDRLQTTNPNIYAAGDICSKYKFTHAADFMARIVIGNTLFMGRAKASALTIPWCTYTTPEIAHVGLYEKDASEQGIDVTTFVQELAENDRAILEGDAEGFVKVHLKKGSDRILGATIVAANAGDMISEISVAMKNGVGLKGIGGTIHPYPTQADAIRRLGDQYNRTRLTPLVASLFRKWLAWTR